MLIQKNKAYHLKNTQCYREQGEINAVLYRFGNGNQFKYFNNLKQNQKSQ